MAFSWINMNAPSHCLAPYRPNPPSIKPPPYPHAFGALDSTRHARDLSWKERYDQKPNNSTYYLTFEDYQVQHLRPSSHCKPYSFQPSYDILHRIVPESDDKVHDIAILRANVEETGGVAVVQYLLHHPATLITYPKTGLTQDLVCDPTRWDGDDDGGGAGNVVRLRDYLVYVNHEHCVWQPLGPPARSLGRGGTVFGMMELRNVADGKLGAVLGSEQSGDGDECGAGKRRLMVRGEWAPGGEVSGVF